MICRSCPKRDDCTTVCDELEKELEEQEVIWHDEPVDSFYYNGEELRRYSYKTGRFKSFLTQTEKKILYAFADGKTREEVANMCRISRTVLRNHIANIREKTRILRRA